MNGLNGPTGVMGAHDAASAVWSELHMHFNAITYPHLVAWEWHIAVYLFIGGLVAGLLLVSGALSLRAAPEWAGLTRLADVTALLLLIPGMLVLWLDLGNGWNAARFYMTFRWTSPMSWGAWILLLCGLLLAARAAAHLPLAARPATGSTALTVLRRAQRPFGWAALVLGTALGIYTGILLGTVTARPMWNVALGPLFLSSGLSAGVAVLAALAPHSLLRRVARASLAAGGLEVGLLALYLGSLLLGPEAVRASAGILTAGEYALPFWLLAAGAGLLLPMALEGVELSGTAGALLARHSRIIPITTAALVLAGSLTLRWVIVYGGQLSHW